MGELIRGIETPRISDTNSPDSAEHREAHAKAEYREVNEKEIAETRAFILNKYHVPPENVSIYEYKKRSTPQRKIRAFCLLTNKLNPEKNFYTECHASHAALNNMMGADFGEKIGVADIHKVFDETNNYLPREPWVYRKGFLDPFHNGFKNFPNLREDLLDLVRENKAINDLQEEGIANIDSDDTTLPNWFLSADTEKERALFTIPKS